MRLPDQRKRLVISGKGAGFQGNVLLGNNRVRSRARIPAGIIPKTAGGQARRRRLGEKLPWDVWMMDVLNITASPALVSKDRNS